MNQTLYALFDIKSQTVMQYFVATDIRPIKTSLKSAMSSGSNWLFDCAEDFVVYKLVDMQDLLLNVSDQPEPVLKLITIKGEIENDQKVS